ncbi:hypothetical protein BKA62DRAFT_715420 [Auriculariales sp. MPI-PUGE-AT-0066]|nr:hypothetical protein BKA62DRAFT_715420 [Auriculariales sp. MPI-PUGE-AT-0066]
MRMAASASDTTLPLTTTSTNNFRSAYLSSNLEHIYKSAMPKEKMNWSSRRSAAEISSWDYVPEPEEELKLCAPDSNTRPKLDTRDLLSGLIEGLNPADPHNPRWCATALNNTLGLIFLSSKGETRNPLLNQAILRYNYPQVYEAFMRFLCCYRTDEEWHATDTLISHCKCTEANVVHASILRDVHLYDGAINPVDEDIMHNHEPLGVLCNLLSHALKDVLQPVHDRAKLHAVERNRASGHPGEKAARKPWPECADDMLPYGPAETVVGLGVVVFRTRNYCALSIAGVLLENIRGPTTKAFLESSYWAQGFVCVGIADLARIGTIIEYLETRKPSPRRRSEFARWEHIATTLTYRVIMFLSHSSLVAHAIVGQSTQPQLLEFNAQSIVITDSGPEDLLSVCCGLVDQSARLLSFAPEHQQMRVLQQSVATEYSSLGARLHYALNLPFSPTSYPPIGDPVRKEFIAHMKLARHLQQTTPAVRTDCRYPVLLLRHSFSQRLYSSDGCNALQAMLRFEDDPRCWARGCRLTAPLVGRKFARCGRCHRVRYCSPECQRRAWADRIDGQPAEVLHAPHRDLCGLLVRVADATGLKPELSSFDRLQSKFTEYELRCRAAGITTEELVKIWRNCDVLVES